MKLKIHHPRILLVLLMVIGAVTASAVLLADRGGSEPVRSVEIPAAPIKPPPTEKQKQDAIDIAKASGIVEQINGGQDWTVEHIGWTALAGTNAISIEVEWRDPVDSTGPWSLIHCKGTRRLVSPIEWSGIIRIEVIVDMKDRSVAGHAVTSEREDIQPIMGSGHVDLKAEFHDVESGKILIEGPLSDLPKLRDLCPPGTFYQG